MNRVLIILLAAGALLGGGAYVLFIGSSEDGLETSLSVAEALGSDTTGFRRATDVRPFSFPTDHGPHPGFKNEWWYVTGNLYGPEGQPYGYELTIFRFALASPDTGRAPRAASMSSDWRTNQLYMAHFAVTDAAAETFYAAERFSRGAVGLAGAQAEPFRVWLENWSMASMGATTFPVRLRAQNAGVAIDLILRPEKPHVLQGNEGLSQKGPGTGNASYYYSYTRLATEGSLVVDGDTVSVSGRSWMDREWSTSALGPNQEGWDWFALQLDDGRDLMYYQLRNDDGSPSAFSEGTLVAPDGSTETIDREDVTIDVLDRWTTPDGSHTYPIEWRLQVPSKNLDLHVTPYVRDQELDVSVRYWEGAVRAEGSVSGRGYVEMTGYGDSPSL